MKMKTLSAAVAATVLALAGGQAIAGSKGNAKGPQASANVLTVCSLDGTSFNVDVVVNDKSSGAVVGQVDAYSLQVTYKDRDSRGRESFMLDGAQTSGGALGAPMPYEIHYSADLCSGDLLTQLANARELNADVTVDYSGAGGEPGKTSMSQCSDDPATDMVEGGVKLSVETLEMLAAACGQ